MQPRGLHGRGTLAIMRRLERTDGVVRPTQLGFIEPACWVRRADCNLPMHEIGRETNRTMENRLLTQSDALDHAAPRG